MEIFQSASAATSRQAGPSAIIAFAVALLAVSVGPSLLSAVASAQPAGPWLARLPMAGAVASAVALYTFLLLRLSPRRQKAIVWLTLAALFMAFFYSFDLSFSFIAQKLPYLLGVGAGTTLYISAVSIVLAFVLALVAAVAKLSGNGIAMGVGSFYTSYFRGVPLLMQLFLIYAGLPQIGYVINPVPAGILALALCYGAYMAEIFRAGILSIPRGQWEAADALGLRRAVTFRRVILPQAMRLIVPPTGNQFIAMLKDSSLVSVVGVWDLMFVARAQGRSDFKMLEMLITASIIYWIMSIVLELAQSHLERRFAVVDNASRSHGA